MYAQDNNPLPVWIILSQAYHHISINSHPFLVGIVSGHNKRTCPTHFKGPENNDQDIQKDNIPTHFKVSENNDQNIQNDIIPTKDNTGSMQIPNPESLVICVRLLCNILWSTLSGE